MKNIKLLITLCVYIFSYSCFAEFEIQSLPAEMKFFSESFKHSFNDSTNDLLKRFASRNRMDFYTSPALLSVDAIITNENLEKAVLVSVNRRVNPEYIKKVFKHSSGYIFQLKLHGQQVSMFFYNFSQIEIKNAFSFLKEGFQTSRAFSLFLNRAEAADDISSGASKLITSQISESEAPVGRKAQSLSYVLGESFVGCGKGAIEGLNNIARAPWDAGWGAGSSAYALYSNPEEWWQRSLDQFKELKNIIIHFREYVKEHFDNFEAKSPKEKNQILCGYFATLVGAGAASKYAKEIGGAVANKSNMYFYRGKEGINKVVFKNVSKKTADELREQASVFNREFIAKFQKEHPKEFDFEFRKWMKKEKELVLHNSKNAIFPPESQYLERYTGGLGVLVDGAWLERGSVKIFLEREGPLERMLYNEFLKSLHILRPK